MNDSLTADARRFRLSFAASVLLNMGLLALVSWLGRPTGLSRPQARPHLRMMTFSVHPAPAPSARLGTKAGVSLAAKVSLPPSQPRSKHAMRRDSPPHVPAPHVPAPHVPALQAPVREAVVSPPALPQPARTAPHQATLDPPVQARPPVPLPPVPLPIRLATPSIRITAAPEVSVTMPPTPVPAPVLPPTAGRVAVRPETSRGRTGGSTDWASGAGTYTGQKPGGPFGIGDGLAADGVTRHIVYVLDTSGSMKSRLDRAEDELMEALRGLRQGETFNIVTFSDGSQMFDPDMAEAEPGNIQRASAFLSGLTADGDTDLGDAVVRALMLRDVNEIVILTDGVPTVGETDPEKLAAVLQQFNVRHARISTIGLVGRNPDGTDGIFAAAQLLQRIAHDSGGTSKFVSLGSAAP